MVKSDLLMLVLVKVKFKVRGSDVSLICSQKQLSFFNMHPVHNFAIEVKGSKPAACSPKIHKHMQCIEY